MKIDNRIILVLVWILLFGFFGYLAFSANPSIVTKKMKFIFWLDREKCMDKYQDSCFFKKNFFDTRGAGESCVVDQIEYSKEGTGYGIAYACQCIKGDGKDLNKLTTQSGWKCKRVDYDTGRNSQFIGN